MKKVYTSADIAEMPQRYRANFINAIEGFKALNLVGSINQDGGTNLAPFNSIFHVGANPPLIGMISRPDTVDRHTLSNLKKSGIYTLNHVHSEIVDQAHQSAARYEVNQSEFDEVGLTAEFLDGFKAPFVKESKVKLGLELRQITPIELNGTILIIGEVVLIEIDDDGIDNDGFIDLQKYDSTAVVGLDAYYQPKLIQRLSYAKPHESLKKV